MKTLLLRTQQLRSVSAKLYDLAKPGSKKELLLQYIYYCLHFMVEKMEGYLEPAH